MIHLITYSNDVFARSKARLCKEAKETGWFDTVTAYGPEDLDADFKQALQSVLSQRRGAGYWVWKPYIIKKKLAEICDGDVLVYLDAGCSICRSGEKRFFEYVTMLQNEKSDGIISFQMNHIEKNWTTKEIFSHFKVDPNGKVANSGQFMSTVRIMRKTSQLQKLIDLELSTYLSMPLLVTDMYNKQQQAECFQDNRHDQSVFSVIRKLHNTIVLPDETFWKHFGCAESLQYPIWATRRRN